MVLNNDIKKMSLDGYTVRKDKKTHQSIGFNFGQPTEVEVEVMVCDQCKNDCRTANLLSPRSEKGSYYHMALYGICLKCDKEYFR